MDVLQLDVSGRPQAWISTKEAAVLYASDGVAWTLGLPCQVLRGGLQRRTGLQSRIEVHPIVAVRGVVPSRAWRQAPALSNPKLFARDRMVCAYCGHCPGFEALTREHILPVSRGGRDSWMNCITACRFSGPSASPVQPPTPANAGAIDNDGPTGTRKAHEFALRVRPFTRRFIRRPM